MKVTFHLSIVLLVGQNMMSIMIFGNKHHIDIDIVYPKNWHLIKYLKLTHRKVTVTIK